MNRESNLFEEITEEIAKSILQFYFHTTNLNEMHLLDGGLFNTTYLLNYDNGKKVILRLGPVNCHLLLEFEKDLMEAEEYIYPVLKERGIPCSNIIAYDSSRSILNRDYVLVEYIDSVVMCNTKLSSDVEKELYQEVGRYAKKIHNITSPMFGTVCQVKNGRGYNKWSEFLIDFVEDALGKGKKYEAFSKEEEEGIRSLFVTYKDLLDEITVPHLVHTDLWCGNILLRDEKIVAIIDADRAIWGDPDFELATPWMVNENFLLGYQETKQEFEKPDRVLRRKIYYLICYVLEAYIGRAEYNNVDMSTNAHKNIREVLNQIGKQ